jgi:hypothetical protein
LNLSLGEGLLHLINGQRRMRQHSWVTGGASDVIGHPRPRNGANHDYTLALAA